MHHHKSAFSRKRKKDGHGKIEYRHCFHDGAHRKGSSRREDHRWHHKSGFNKSEHKFFINRKGMFPRLKIDTSPITGPSRYNESTENTGLKLSVDLERCVRCGKCEQVCPMGAIMVNEDIFRVDSSLCNGCGRCVDGCRQGALSLRKDQEVFMN